MTEKQAKELREARGGHNLLENFNNRSVMSHHFGKLHVTDENISRVEV